MAAREEYRQSSVGIRRLKAQLHDSARQADVITRERGDLQARMQQLEESNSELANNNSRTSTGYLILLALVPAVYLLDVLLFGPTAEILSERAFYGYPVMTWIARLLVPLAIVIIELAIALEIYLTRQESETYYGPRTGHYLRVVIGICFALVMPCLVIGTSLVQSAFENESVRKGLYWQLAGLVILTLMHVFIIFGGRFAHESKTFFVHNLKKRSLQRKFRQYNREYDGLTRAFRGEFDSFYELLTRHRQTFQDNYEPGPFDMVTRNFARTLYGYDVIQPTGTPAGTAATELHFDQRNPNPGSSPAPEENGGIDPRVRAEESEVRV